MKDKTLVELRLPDLWKEFKQNFYESFWEEMEQEIKLMKKKYIEAALQEEIQTYTKAKKYERSSERQFRRNGYWKRYITLKDGSLEIKMPRLREKGFETMIIPRYKRRQEEIDETLKQIFIYGASTRLTSRVLEPIFGEKLSAQTISNISRSLDEEVRKFHTRQIQDKYLYLFVDAIMLKMKTGVGSKLKAVLVAYGITVKGFREIIDFRAVNSENENNWTGFLQDLQIRGLTFDTLSLIVTDGKQGLENAVDNVLPLVRRQRCWAHKMRNVATYLKKKDRAKCLGQAKRIYNASNRKEAKKVFDEWKQSWGNIYPKAVHCIEKDWEELTAFFDTPKNMWKKLRTTNVIERSFRELRRRTKTMSCFNNVKSIERISFAVINHLNEQYRSKPLYEFTHNS